MTIADYGLQLLGKVRQYESESIQGDLHDMQLVQNKLAHVLNNAKLSEHRSMKSLLTKINMQSVNQLNAHIKITEIWKAVHRANYPIEVKNALWKMVNESLDLKSQTNCL